MPRKHAKNCIIAPNIWLKLNQAFSITYFVYYRNDEDEKHFVEGYIPIRFAKVLLFLHMSRLNPGNTETLGCSTSTSESDAYFETNLCFVEWYKNIDKRPSQSKRLVIFLAAKDFAGNTF